MSTHYDNQPVVTSSDSKTNGSQAEIGPSEILSFMTTEHFTLQTASSSTISESSGRASIFLATVSGTLIALTFIGNVSQLGDEFFLFALILFPSLFFIGLVTFVRVLETAIANISYVQGMNRIRHYYLELAPQMRPYFVLSDKDDALAMSQGSGSQGGAWWFEIFMTTASMIAVINSVLIGVFVGILARHTFGYDMTVAVVSGIVAFLLFMTVHMAYQQRKWSRSNTEVLFPSGETEVGNTQTMGVKLNLHQLILYHNILIPCPILCGQHCTGRKEGKVPLCRVAAYFTGDGEQAGGQRLVEAQRQSCHVEQDAGQFALRDVPGERHGIQPQATYRRIEEQAVYIVQPVLAAALRQRRIFQDREHQAGVTTTRQVYAREYAGQQGRAEQRAALPEAAGHAKLLKRIADAAIRAGERRSREVEAVEGVGAVQPGKCRQQPLTLPFQPYCQPLTGIGQLCCTAERLHYEVSRLQREAVAAEVVVRLWREV